MGFRPLCGVHPPLVSKPVPTYEHNETLLNFETEVTMLVGIQVWTENIRINCETHNGNDWYYFVLNSITNLIDY